jgi:hypothetical protein
MVESASDGSSPLAIVTLSGMLPPKTSRLYTPAEVVAPASVAVAPICGEVEVDATGKVAVVGERKGRAAVVDFLR